MKFGHFDDANREYVITTPLTPYPWINYLGNEKFFSLISNTSGGYAFFTDARLRRLTRYRYNDIPLDTNGRYLYIKDGDTIWNPGYKPMKTKLDSYECRHGFGYTKISSSKNFEFFDKLFHCVTCLSRVFNNFIGRCFQSLNPYIQRTVGCWKYTCS